MNKLQGLLNWCKYQTYGYPNVSITNFTTSWRNGLAFNALIHKYKPELVNFHELESDNIFYNNYIAFKTAEMHFGIPALLDPKDMSFMECPERLSIITYVSQFYNCLKEMKPEGGYDINKFGNTKIDNLEFDSISSRASVNRLTKLKCTICSQKVFLLERYVADDKLYHRKCYRDVQIKGIDNESEVIGDYLNIYGELKPTMNKGIFVHPIQGLISNNSTLEIKTTTPVNIVEESGSEIVESEDISESLSSYGYSDNDSDDISNLNSDEDHLFPSENCNIIKEFDRGMAKEENYENKENHTISNTSQNENRSENSCVNEKESDNGKKGDEENSSKENTEQFNEREIVQASCQENLVVSITKNTPVNPVKQRLYIKKRDKALPYSTFFEVPGGCNEDNYYDDNSICLISVTHSKDVIRKESPPTISGDLSTIDKSKLNLNYPSGSLSTIDKTTPNLNSPSDPLPSIDKTTPNLNSPSDPLPSIDKTPPNLNSPGDGLLVRLRSSSNPVRKVIEIVPDEEYESDASNMDDQSYDCVKPQIIRDSIWRKPIISSVAAHHHKSECISIEGKFRDYVEFKDRLEELNTKQSDIETKARKVQQKLWQEDSHTPLYELLLTEWLNLVEEKDKIFYEENALYSWIKDLKLQEMRQRLEAQIRILSSSGANDPATKEKEKELVAKLIETVNKRSEIVDTMHEENVRRLDMLKLRHRVIENVTNNKAQDPSKSKHPDTKPVSPVKNKVKFWKRKTWHF